MNNRNFPANKTDEQRGLAYIRPSDNRHVGQRVALMYQSSRHLGFRRMRVAFGLQLTHAVCNVKDPGNQCERAGCKHNVKQGNDT
jgi:hypothetical protein